MRNRHVEFLKSIRLPEEEKTNEKNQGMEDIQINKRAKQEEMDLQKELEQRFDELFGITEED